MTPHLPLLSMRRNVGASSTQTRSKPQLQDQEIFTALEFIFALSLKGVRDPCTV